MIRRASDILVEKDINKASPTCGAAVCVVE